MGKRILVADDSRTIQQAFAMVMDGAGYTLGFAKSVDEALAVAKRDGRPDLVLSDAVLGNGSGYDLCAQFKAEAGLGDVPIYILASAQNPYDDARGRKVGADGHMLKPFESQALLDAVASALATPARRSSAAMPAEAIDASSTSRYSEDEVAGEDDDSYGEITIERGSTAPAPAPAASAWTARPPTRPSSARPAPTGPAPASVAPPQPVPPRAPMIPAPRPSIAMPSVPSGPLPPSLGGGLPPLPSPPQARQPARTMMGFPSPKTGAAPRPGGFPIPGGLPLPSPSGATPSRPPTMPPATAPVRGPSFPSSSPPAAPLVSRPAPSSPSMPMAAPRPAPSRLMATPASPTASIPAAAIAPQAIPRRPMTPEPAALQSPPATLASAVAAAASEKVEQQMAALAARGPEYEAIAKLSREIIEQVVWEVVPELAETIIRQEIDRLASARK